MEDDGGYPFRTPVSREMKKTLRKVNTDFYTSIFIFAYAGKEIKCVVRAQGTGKNT